MDSIETQIVEEVRCFPNGLSPRKLWARLPHLNQDDLRDAVTRLVDDGVLVVDAYRRLRIAT